MNLLKKTFLLIVFLSFSACNNSSNDVVSNNDTVLLKKEIETLKTEIKRLKIELEKCDTLVNIYENKDTEQ